MRISESAEAIVKRSRDCTFLPVFEDYKLVSPEHDAESHLFAQFLAPKLTEQLKLALPVARHSCPQSLPRPVGAALDLGSGPCEL